MIYIITNGIYSDYHICAATTDKKRAKDLQMIFSDSYSEARIEEFEDGVSGKEESLIVRPWYVQIQKGDFGKGYIETKENIRQYTEILPPGMHHENKFFFRDKAPNLGVNAYVIANNEEHAMKIVKDKWAEHMAEIYAI